MKRISLLILFIFLSFLVVAQHSSDNSATTDTYKKMKNEISYLKKEIKDLQVNSQDVKKYKESKEETDNERNFTISLQNSWIANFGVVFTVMAIVVALLGIGIPYFLGVIPARNAIKELQNDLDKKVANYLEIERIKKIDKYAKDLNGSNEELKQTAISFFSTNRNEDFADSHLMKFYSYIKKNPNSDRLFVSLLASRKNDFADLLFGDPKEITRDFFETDGLLYISKYGKENFNGIIKAYLQKDFHSLSKLFNSIQKLKGFNLFDEDAFFSKNDYDDLIKTSLMKNEAGLSGLFDVIDFIKNIGLFTAKELFDNKDLINNIPNKPLSILKSIEPAVVNLTKRAEITLDDFDKTYLAEKIKAEEFRDPFRQDG